jgi:ABC-type branched-subunit amino acid transport system ATPase component
VTEQNRRSSVVLALDRFTYRRAGALVVDGVTFDVRRSDAVAIVGPTGAGKSTLARLLARSLRGYEGSARLRTDGQTVELSTLEPWQVSRLGVAYVPEANHIFPDLTVDENLAVAITNLPAAVRGDACGREYTLSRFPLLSERRNQAAGTMSGGEQRMLALACAVLHLRARSAETERASSGLLIVDEPSHGLHRSTAAQLAEVLSEIRREAGIAVLLFEQHLSFAEHCSERIGVLDRGRLVSAP